MQLRKVVDLSSKGYNLNCKYFPRNIFRLKKRQRRLQFRTGRILEEVKL
jgi:hypothetical protein